MTTVINDLYNGFIAALKSGKFAHESPITKKQDLYKILEANGCSFDDNATVYTNDFSKCMIMFIKNARANRYNQYYDLVPFYGKEGDSTILVVFIDYFMNLTKPIKEEVVKSIIGHSSEYEALVNLGDLFIRLSRSDPNLLNTCIDKYYKLAAKFIAAKIIDDVSPDGFTEADVVDTYNYIRKAIDKNDINMLTYGIN